jgi:ubiquinone/menaquinone biosynthesis C-methylase UbiE
MATDYDPIAEQYKRSKLQRWRARVEAFTLIKLVGDLAGKAVVDVACGEGFYTRILRQRGAAKVTGLDLSPKMIELARNSEVREPLGIGYIVGDGRDMNFGPVYDLAAAAYFLNYAHDRAELEAMCNGSRDASSPADVS